MNTTLNFIRGANRKPVASKELEKSLSSIRGLHGECFFGYPLIAAPEGKFTIDAALISPEKGVILFELIEGTQVPVDYDERQDDLANKIESRLKMHRELVDRRQLCVPIHVITFVPAITNTSRYSKEGYHLANASTLGKILSTLSWEQSDGNKFLQVLSAIESISSIRKSRTKREVVKSDSRGAKLKRLEDAIATLDLRQNRAVIETVDGVQRIRGLAGSGKTIVLALKAAYLHSQYPDWRIAVTFNTRSLKGQFKRFINNFCVEQTGEEPDWTRIRVINAWGAPGGEERDGIYYEFCRASGIEFYDFQTARFKFRSADRAFEGACEEALLKVTDTPKLYDAILVDEAQDFSSSFLRLCYAILGDPKRLIYAYDELQNLSGESMPSPEDIFGVDKKGRPLVTLGDDSKRDVILDKCYRNSRPVLTTAHSLGFGIYRKPQKYNDTGLVQMFDHPRLWEEIGYRIEDGQLAEGKRVVLCRTQDTSPVFLEDHSHIDDLIQFLCFENEAEQNDWLVKSIQHNLNQDELRHDDIVVIHIDPITTRDKTGPIRETLFNKGIRCHLAGVDTDADVFFKTVSPSITFTGIYRAKGNEAGMVYVINAQDCYSTGHNLASFRNRLFTAITRSKAWVRVIGYGPRMTEIEREFQELKNHDFKLDFIYPTQPQLERLRIVHRDLSPSERKRLDKRQKGLEELIHDIEIGRIHLEDIDTATRNKLKKLFSGIKYNESDPK